MADNKQYITQVQENGTVIISEEVIATIVHHAATEVEGVVGLSGKFNSEIVELLGKKNWSKGIKIAIGENDAVSIDCNVVIAYGQSVVSVASAVQSAISAALESMTGVTVAAVNVNVCGITRQ